MSLFGPATTQDTPTDPAPTGSGPDAGNQPAVDLRPLDQPPSFATETLPQATPPGPNFDHDSPIDLSLDANSRGRSNHQYRGVEHRERVIDNVHVSPSIGETNYLETGMNSRPGYDETNLAGAFDTVHRGTGLNPHNESAMKSFLERQDTIERSNIHRALADISSLNQTRDLSISSPGTEVARYEAFDNFIDRYVSAYAGDQAEANLMDQQLELVRDALIAESDTERAEAVAELRRRYGDDDPLVQAVQGGGLGQIDEVVAVLKVMTETEYQEKRAEHQGAGDTNAVRAEVLREMHRDNNQLASDFINIAGAGGIPEAEQLRIDGLLQTGDPTAIDQALEAYKDFPEIVEGLQAYKAQQLFNEAQFGDPANRDANLEAARDILVDKLGVPPGELNNGAGDPDLGKMREVLPRHTAIPILSMTDDRTSAQVTMTEYSRMPMVERVARLEAFAEECRLGQYDGKDKEFLMAMQEIYEGLGPEQADQLRVMYNERNPEHGNSNINGMRYIQDTLDTLSYDTETIATKMQNGVVPAEYAELMEIHCTASDGLGFNRDEELRGIMGMLTTGQRAEMFEGLESLATDQGYDDPLAMISAYCDDNLPGAADSPDVSQALPGTSGTNIPGLSPMDRRNKDVEDLIEQLETDIADAQADASLDAAQKQEAINTARARARDQLLDVLESIPDADRSRDTRLLMIDNPDLATALGDIIKTADDPAIGPDQDKKLNRDLVCLANGVKPTELGFDAAQIDTIKTGLDPAATNAQRDAAIALLEANLRGGAEGATQAKALSAILEAETGSTLSELVTGQASDADLDQAARDKYTLLAHGISPATITHLVDNLDPNSGPGIAQLRAINRSIGSDTPEQRAAQALFGTKVSEAYETKHGRTLEGDFVSTDDADQRARDLASIYGEQMAQDIQQSAANLKAIIDQGGDGRNVDEQFHRAAEQIDRLADQRYPGARNDTFLRLVREQYEATAGESLQDDMEKVCSSDDLKGAPDLLGLDFSEIEATPERQGNEIDADIEGVDIDGDDIDLEDIVDEIENGTYTLDDFTKHKEQLIEHGGAEGATLAEQLGPRIAEAWRRHADGALSSELDLSKIPGPSTPEERFELMAAFYGDAYADQFNADLSAVQNATTADELEIALRGVSDYESFAQHYEYVQGNSLKADLEGKLTTPAARREFNSRFTEADRKALTGENDGLST